MDRELLQNKEGVYKKDYEIRAEHVDAAGKVTAGTLARFMQNMTEDHMRAYGITFESLLAKDLIWVIVCSQIEFLRLPKEGEIVEQYSWAGGEKFGMHSRRYAFFTKEGEELLHAASLFLLVNKDSRALSKPIEETVSLPIVVIEGEPKLPKMMQKYPLLSFAQKRQAAHTEIDHNNHVNNACYIDWLYEIITPEYLRSTDIKGMWIQYEKEVVLGDEIELKFVNAGDSVFVRGSVAGADCFKIKMDV